MAQHGQIVNCFSKIYDVIEQITNHNQSVLSLWVSDNWVNRLRLMLTDGKL